MFHKASIFVKLPIIAQAMHLEALVEYCSSKPGVTDSFPFGGDTLVFKVMGKMWALCGIDDLPLKVNLKCDPERAQELREQYEEVQPGYHMNKQHWNTVTIGEGMLEQSLILELIDHSYDLIVKSLTKAKKTELAALKEG